MTEKVNRSTRLRDFRDHTALSREFSISAEAARDEVVLGTALEKHEDPMCGTWLALRRFLEGREQAPKDGPFYRFDNRLNSILQAERELFYAIWWRIEGDGGDLKP